MKTKHSNKFKEYTRSSLLLDATQRAWAVCKLTRAFVSSALLITSSHRNKNVLEHVPKASLLTKLLKAASSVTQTVRLVQSAQTSVFRVKIQKCFYRKKGSVTKFLSVQIISSWLRITLVKIALLSVSFVLVQSLTNARLAKMTRFSSRDTVLKSVPLICPFWVQLTWRYVKISATNLLFGWSLSNSFWISNAATPCWL